MTRTILIAATLALAVTLPIAPAQATGLNRTFVSAAGSDSNNCANVLTPCRHLATAFAATAQDGEIYVLDPANYGSLTITHGVSIEGHGWASIAPPGINSVAITINANPGDKINIIGVVLDGTAIANTNGILFNSGGSLTVRDSVIRNFGENGIEFFPANASNLVVSNTLIASNGLTGVYIVPQTDNLTVQAVLNRVELHNNSDGLNVTDFSGSGGTIDVSAVDTVASNNRSIGFYVETQNVNSSVTHVSLVRVTVAENGDTGVWAQGAQSTIRLAQSLLTGNGQAW